MSRKPTNLVWNVVAENVNQNRIGVWNIFDHSGFLEDVKKNFKKYKDNKEKFADELRRSLMYYYWSKSEWEVILSNQNNRMTITPWIGGWRNDINLDVTYDESFDWRGFYDKMVECYIKEKDSVKIDVYDQVVFRWDEFLTYAWDRLSGN